MIAYLSGAMEYANDEGKSWRTNITEWLSKNLNHSVINPVEESHLIIDKTDAHNYRDWKENDRSRYKDFIKQFVIRDIEAVTREANYIICLWNEDVFNLLPLLSEARARGLPARTRKGLQVILQARWVGLLEIAVQRTSAQSILRSRGGDLVDGGPLEPLPVVADLPSL